MNINLVIDGQSISVSAYPQESLSSIIRREVYPNALKASECMGQLCGNCIVLEAETKNPILACLMSAFEAKGKEFITIKGFSGTVESLLIEDVMNSFGVHPCQKCYDSKVLLFESASQRIIRHDSLVSNIGSGWMTIKGKKGGKLTYSERNEIILDTVSLSRCHCISQQDMVAIVERIVEKSRGTT